VEAHLQVQLETVSRLAALRPGLRCLLARAPSIDAAQIDACVAGVDAGAIGLEVVADDSRRVLEAADVVLAKPGTGTTEAMLIGCPMVVMARAHPLTAFIVRLALRVPHLAMPNLIAGERIVPEFWQREAEPDAIARALDALFDGPARDGQRKALAQAAARLGPPGAIDRVASLVFEMLAKRGAGPTAAVSTSGGPRQDRTGAAARA
jgi:lipid-A-disaccharide synthase